jgi:hypothetical protein
MNKFRILELNSITIRGEPVHEEGSASAQYSQRFNIRSRPSYSRGQYSSISVHCASLPRFFTRDKEGWAREFPVKVAAQIGDVIGKCSGYQSGLDSTNTFIIPRLEMDLAWDEPSIARFKRLIRTLLDRVDHLSRLPICWTHWDVNMMNIMVDDGVTVTGISDWEESYSLPLRMNTGHISELAAYNQRGVLGKIIFR